MNNDKLNKKIQDIKFEIEDLVSKINEEKNDDGLNPLNFSAQDQSIIKEENIVINSSLDFLDQENEKLLLKIDQLKKDVQEALAKLANENTFVEIIEKFAHIYGFENIDKEQLNKFFDIEKKYVADQNIVSQTQIEKMKHEDVNEPQIQQTPVSQLIAEMQQLFEQELSLIETINANKEKFIAENTAANSITDESKLVDIFAKIDELKLLFSNNLKRVYLTNVTDSKIEELKSLYNNLNEAVVDSYENLKKEFTQSVSWKTFLNDLPATPAMVENANNFDLSYYDNLDEKIMDLESKIKIEKAKHDNSDFSLESFNSYLLFNKIDDSSLEVTLKSMYGECLERFIESLASKKEEVQDTTTNLEILILSVVKSLITKIEIAKKNSQTKVVFDHDISNNNFFNQKIIELFEKIKITLKDIINFLNSSISSLLQVFSIDILKNNYKDFDKLIKIIDDAKNEYNLVVSKWESNIKDELVKIFQLPTYEYDELKNKIGSGIDECIKQVNLSVQEFDELTSMLKKIEKEFKIHKFNKLENVYETISAYQAKTQEEFQFGTGNDYVGARLQRLENQFSKFINILDPLNKKINETNKVDYDEMFKSFEEKITSKIDVLMSNIAKERESIEKTNNLAIEQILESNRNQKQSILNLIKEIEEEKMNIISDNSAKNLMENNAKLSELEHLIEVQSSEIESLLNEKNEFISEIETFLAHKKDKLSDEKFEELQQSVDNLMLKFSNKIDDLEYNFDRKMSMIDLSTLDLTINNNQKDFFDSIESKLTNNYELVKQELKTDLIDISNNISQLKEDYLNGKNNSNYDQRFDEISSQFEQFGFLLKNLNETIASQQDNTNKNGEIETLVSNLNEKFELLAKNIKEENIKSNALINKKVNRTSKQLTSKIMSNFDSINEKFTHFFEQSRQDKIISDSQHTSTINAIIQANNVNKKEILDRLEIIEQEKIGLLNEIETNKLLNENTKLRELEDLINVQNSEIESLLSEKNEFVSQIEHILRNKYEELSNEKIDELQQSVNNLMVKFSDKIDNLEYNFDRKINQIDLSTLDQNINESQREFFDSIESKLTNNYELVKQELKTDLIDISNNINQLRDDYANSNQFLIFEQKFDEITSQFEQFSFILKNISEKMADDEKDDNKANEIEVLVSSLNERFENLIKNLREENNKSNAILNRKVNRTSKQLTSRIMSNFNIINEKFANFLEQTKQDKINLDTKHTSTINAIIEANNSNKKEILDRLEMIEQEKIGLFNEFETNKLLRENNKLRELEDLINLQNSEIESLLSEKNEFISQIEHVLRNKYDELSNENIDELKTSISQLMYRMDERIQHLEDDFDKKITNMNETNKNADVSKAQREFFDSLENRLSSNYELVKNEFKTDLIDILNNINQLKDDYNSLKEMRQDNGIEEIKDQFEQFSFLLKNISEKLIEQDETKSKEVDMLMSNLNSQFETLINNIKEENEKTSKKIISKVVKSNKNLSKKFNNNIIEMNKTFNNFINDIKKENEKLVQVSMDSIKGIFEANKINKQDIYEIIEELEAKNFDLLSELDARRKQEENTKLKELEKLIDKQNEEIVSLIEEKNAVIEEIENIILENRGSIASMEKNDQMQESLENIIIKFDNRINVLEHNLNKKIDEMTMTNSNEIDMSPINEQVQRIETNLVENYGFLREDIRNIFLDLSHKFQDLSNAVYNNPLADSNMLVQNLFNEIQDLKDMSNSLMVEVKENSNTVLRIENILEQQLANIIQEQKEAFNNLSDKLINEQANQKVDELEKWFSTMKDLIETQSDFVEYLHNKLDDIELSIERIETSNANNIKNMLDNMADKIERNEIAINSLHESAALSFKDLKNVILDRIDHLVEFQQNEAQTHQLLSLTSKLNELEDLLALQEDQTNLLIEEKNQLIDKLDEILSKEKVEEKEIEKIATETISLDKKLDILYQTVSKNIAEIVSLSTKRNLVDIDAIDAQISGVLNSTNQIMTLVKTDDTLAVTNAFETQEKLELLTNKLVDLQKDIEQLDESKVDENNFKEFNAKLDSLRNALLCCDFDLLAIKEATMSNDNEINDPKLNLEYQSLNKEKIGLVNDLISHNKQYLSNILNQKTELVNLLLENKNLKEDNFIESKASYYVDMLSEKLFEKQHNEYKALNNKIEELRKKYNLFNKNASIKNIDLASEIQKLEAQILRSFEIVENKKKEIINILSTNIDEESDDFKNIIDKFEANKQEIQKEYDEELINFKNEILSMKNQEIENCKKEVKDIETEISSLKESQLSNDEEQNQIVKKDFEPLENLVEELNFEINSFIEEKENLYDEIKKKIEFLNSLDSPENDEDHIGAVNTTKFKDSINEGAKKLIENEFNSFNLEFRKNLELVKVGFKKIKTAYDNEIDNPSWFKTFNDKLEKIEQSLIAEKVEKDKNINEKSNNELELNNDNLQIDEKAIISYVNGQENRKKEIENFYKKVRDLEEYWKNK